MIFDVARKDIETVQGDSLVFALEFESYDDDGDIIDLSSAFFTVRGAFDGEIICQASLNSGIAKEEPGVYSVRLSPEQTANLEPGNYYYDLQVGLGDDVFTIVTGVLQSIPSVTGGESNV